MYGTYHTFIYIQQLINVVRCVTRKGIERKENHCEWLLARWSKPTEGEAQDGRHGVDAKSHLLRQGTQKKTFTLY